MDEVILASVKIFFAGNSAGQCIGSNCLQKARNEQEAEYGLIARRHRSGNISIVLISCLLFRRRPF